MATETPDYENTAEPQLHELSSAEIYAGLSVSLVTLGLLLYRVSLGIPRRSVGEIICLAGGAMSTLLATVMCHRASTCRATGGPSFLLIGVILTVAIVMLMLPVYITQATELVSLDGVFSEVGGHSRNIKIIITVDDEVYKLGIDGVFIERVRKVRRGTPVTVMLDGNKIAAFASAQGVVLTYAEYVERRTMEARIPTVLVLLFVGVYTYVTSARKLRRSPRCLQV